MLDWPENNINPAVTKQGIKTVQSFSEIKRTNIIGFKCTLIYPNFSLSDLILSFTNELTISLPDFNSEANDSEIRISLS